MMLEQGLMEDAEAYVFGQLNDTRRSSFEWELSHDHDLQCYVHEIEDGIAAFALTAPQIQPPDRLLKQIEAQIESKAALTHRSSGFWKAPAAVAAALVMLSGVTIYQWREKLHWQELALDRESQMNHGGADSRAIRKSAGESHNKAALAGDSATEEPLQALQALIAREQSGNLPTYELIQDFKKLEGSLQKLKLEKEKRFQLQPGISRMVVTKLLNPELDEVEKKERLRGLSGEVSDIIVSGLNSGDTAEIASEETAEEPIVLSGNDNRKGANFIIEEGMVPAGMIDLPEGSTLVHRNFPKDRIDEFSGIDRISDESFYDRPNQILWEEDRDGIFRGTRVKERPQGGEAEPPPVTQEESQPPVKNEIPKNTNTDPLAYTLFDETTGEGRLVVSNIPAPGEGNTYQLWMNHPETGDSISVGVFDHFEGGDGVLSYNLPEAGVSPTEYQITVEPAEGSATPSGQTLLLGPR